METYVASRLSMSAIAPVVAFPQGLPLLIADFPFSRQSSAMGWIGRKLQRRRLALAGVAACVAIFDYWLVAAQDRRNGAELTIDVQPPLHALITDRADPWPTIGSDGGWSIRGNPVSLRNETGGPSQLVQSGHSPYWAKVELGPEKTFGQFIRTMNGMKRDGYCIALLKDQSDRTSGDRTVMPLAIDTNSGGRRTEKSACNGYGSHPTDRPIVRNDLYSDRW